MLHVDVGSEKNVPIYLILLFVDIVELQKITERKRYGFIVGI